MGAGGSGHGHQLAASAEVTRNRMSTLGPSAWTAALPPWALLGEGGQMEKYLPAEREAQANTRTLAVSKDRAAAFHTPQASLHG